MVDDVDAVGSSISETTVVVVVGIVVVVVPGEALSSRPAYSVVEDAGTVEVVEVGSGPGTTIVVDGGAANCLRGFDTGVHSSSLVGYDLTVVVGGDGRASVVQPTMIAVNTAIKR